jgi:hypothetical protein
MAFHQQVGPAGTEGLRPVVIELGRRDAARSRRDHGRRFDGHIALTL